MKYDDYFIAPEEVKRMMRRKLLRTLEDLYIYETTEDEIEDMTFEQYLQRTKEDMELVENYEGAQIIKDIKKYNGWR